MRTSKTGRGQMRSHNGYVAGPQRPAGPGSKKDVAAGSATSRSKETQTSQVCMQTSFLASFEATQTQRTRF